MKLEMKDSKQGAPSYLTNGNMYINGEMWAKRQGYNKWTKTIDTKEEVQYQITLTASPYEEKYNYLKFVNLVIDENSWGGVLTISGKTATTEVCDPKASPHGAIAIGGNYEDVPLSMSVRVTDGQGTATVYPTVIKPSAADAPAGDQYFTITATPAVGWHLAEGTVEQGYLNPKWYNHGLPDTEETIKCEWSFSWVQNPIAYEQEVKFERNEWELLATVSNGKVNGEDYIKEQKKYEESITLTAEPEAGYEFYRWLKWNKEISNYEEYSRGERITFPMENNSMTFHAECVKKSYRVTVSSEHGTPYGTGDYNAGDTVRIGLYPEDGWRVSSWSNGETGNSFVYTVPTADSELTATCEKV